MPNLLDHPPSSQRVEVELRRPRPEAPQVVPAARRHGAQLLHLRGARRLGRAPLVVVVEEVGRLRVGEPGHGEGLGGRREGHVAGGAAAVGEGGEDAEAAPGRGVWREQAEAARLLCVLVLFLFVANQISGPIWICWTK